MRVLQVSASIDPTDGGPATGMLALNRELRSLGVDATLLTTDFENAVGPDPVALNLTGTNVTRYKSGFPRRLKWSRDLAHALRRSVRSYDIVHIHGLYLHHTFAAARTARKFGVPYVVQPHGTLEPYQRKRSRFWKFVYDATVGRHVIRDASRVIFASDAEERNARDIAGGRGVVVRLGADLENAVAPECGSDVENGPLVLFLGRLAVKKRAHLLLLAWPIVLSAIPEAQLVVAGPDADEEAREAWNRAFLALSPAQAATITRRSFVAGAEKAKLYASASVFVLPSENENFGVSVAEALIAGLPVVITDHVAFAEDVRAHDLGKVAKDVSPEGLAACIIEVLADDDYRRAVSHNALRYATDLTWTAAARRMVAAYNGVLQGEHN